MSTETDTKQWAARAMAEQGQQVAVLLKSKLMAQLTPEQRDTLSVIDRLIAINDAVFVGEEGKIVRRPPTNLSHARIVAEVQYGQELLTGCDHWKISAEDRAWSDAGVERAGLKD